MFNWVGSQFDSVLSVYVLGVVNALIAAITPLALTCMTLWIAFYGWAVMRNEVAEPVQTFLWKVFKIGLVLAFALQSGFYINNVSSTANSLAMGVASTFLPAGIDPTTITSPYALLDRFNDDASAQVAEIMRDATMFRLDLLLAAVIFSFGSVVFLCIGLFVVTLSKLLLTFVIAVGPLFILCLAWRPTARFFDSWLSMTLNAVVLTWFAFFALGLSAFMGNQMFVAIQSSGGFANGNLNVLTEATRYCILMILLAIICFQAPSLAAALTGGAAVQQGIQMVQNALMVAGLRSAAASGSRASLQGGAIRPSGGVVAAGVQWARSATRSPAGQPSFGSGPISTSTSASPASRPPAYRMAALRGRA